MTKIKFHFEAGMFLRKSIRNSLIELKNTILFDEPDASIKIEETKFFLYSSFYFIGTNLSDITALEIKNWVYKIRDKY